MRKPVAMMTISLAAVLHLGCGENETERKQREQMERRNEALRGQASSEKLKAQLVTNTFLSAKKAVVEKNQSALNDAVAELKKLGTPAVERLQDELKKDGKVDRMAVISILGEMGKEASTAASALERIVKEETDNEIKDTAAKALSKIRAN